MAQAYADPNHPLAIRDFQSQQRMQRQPQGYGQGGPGLPPPMPRDSDYALHPMAPAVRAGARSFTDQAWQGQQQYAPGHPMGDPFEAEARGHYQGLTAQAEHLYNNSPMGKPAVAFRQGLNMGPQAFSMAQARHNASPQGLMAMADPGPRAMAPMVGGSPAIQGMAPQAAAPKVGLIGSSSPPAGAGENDAPSPATLQAENAPGYSPPTDADYRASNPVPPPPFAHVPMRSPAPVAGGRFPADQREVQGPPAPILAPARMGGMAAGGGNPFTSQLQSFQGANNPFQMTPQEIQSQDLDNQLKHAQAQAMLGEAGTRQAEMNMRQKELEFKQKMWDQQQKLGPGGVAALANPEFAPQIAAQEQHRPLHEAASGLLGGGPFNVPPGMGAGDVAEEYYSHILPGGNPFLGEDKSPLGIADIRNNFRARGLQGLSPGQPNRQIAEAYLGKLFPGQDIAQLLSGSEKPPLGSPFNPRYQETAMPPHMPFMPPWNGWSDILSPPARMRSAASPSQHIFDYLGR